MSEALPHLRLWHVDGMRLVFAAAVVANHLDERWLPGGFLGVDCFYVISGYVVTLSVAHRGKQQCLRAGLSFYERRIHRLLNMGEAGELIALVKPFQCRKIFSGEGQRFIFQDLSANPFGRSIHRHTKMFAQNDLHIGMKGIWIGLRVRLAEGTHSFAREFLYTNTTGHGGMFFQINLSPAPA